jgi:integrase
MSTAINALIANHLASSSYRTYSYHTRKMIIFSRILNISHLQTPSPSTMERYILLHCSNFAYSSLATFLSAIAKHYNTSTLQLSTPRIYKLRKGLKRLLTKGVKVKRAFPITFRVLMRLISTLDKRNTHNYTIMMMLTLSYSCLLRFSELYNIRRSDITVTSDHHNYPTTFVTIRYSKADLRPVTLQLCNTASTFLHIYLDANKHIKPNDFIVPRNLDLHAYNKILKIIAKKAQFTHHKHFSSHGCRAGHATDLFSQGHNELYIKIKGRWASDSFLRYIRPLFIHTTSTSNITNAATFTKHLDTLSKSSVHTQPQPNVLHDPIFITPLQPSLLPAFKAA